MAGETIESVFRDFETAGVPSSGAHEPRKNEIRNLLNVLAFDGEGGGNQVIQLNNAGEGTGNAIEVTTAEPIPDAAFRAVYVLNVTDENTGPVTIAINSAAAVPVVDNVGQPLDAGVLVPGMGVLALDDGENLRLFVYGDVQAILNAAEAARDAAQTAADEATSAVEGALQAERNLGDVADKRSAAINVGARISVFFWLSEATITKILFRSAGAAEEAEIAAALQAGVDYLSANGGGVLFCPAGYYPYNLTVEMKAGVFVEGDGPATEFAISGNQPAFRAIGECQKTQGNTLASDGLRGDRSFTLTPGKGANFAADNYAIIWKDQPYDTSNTQNVGQIVQVLGKSDDTITINSPLQYDFTVALASEVWRMDLLADLGLRNCSVRATVPEENTSGLSAWIWCLRPLLENVVMGNCFDHGALFIGCVDHEVKNGKFHDLASSDTAPYYGYAVEEAGPNLGGKFDILAKRVRHAYTTTTATSTMPCGEPVGSRVTGTAIDCYASAWDTHQPGSDILFYDCQVIGGQRVGFQLRNRKSAVRGGTVVGTVGAAAWVIGTGSNRIASDIVIEGLQATKTNLGIDDIAVDWRERGAIFDQGIRSLIKNNRIYECGGPGIMGDGPLFEDAEWCGNRVQAPCGLTAGKRFAIGYEGVRSTALRIEDNTIRGDNAVLVNGIYVPSTNVKAVHEGNRVTGTSGNPIEVNNAHYAARNPGGKLMFALGPFIGLTIAGGSVTLPSTDVGYGGVNLTGEGALADDLDTIVSPGTAINAVLVLRRATGGAITIKHGTGNILITTEADVILSSSLQSITLRWNGTAWVEWFRSV